MNFKSFRLFRKTLFVPVIQLRYNKYIQRADGGNDMANTTKLALEASLKELLRTKPIDRITINDLTEHCLHHYYHSASCSCDPVCLTVYHPAEI
jgi:hypothetical protein